jgi:hypothetical protein
MAKILRRYRITDAPAVSGLFEAIYGTRYPQPHVYLPCMINQNHSDGRWHSLVAEVNGQIAGMPPCFAGQADPHWQNCTDGGTSGYRRGRTSPHGWAGNC